MHIETLETASIEQKTTTPASETILASRLRLPNVFL
jgi:hypothetical protein